MNQKSISSVIFTAALLVSVKGYACDRPEQPSLPATGKIEHTEMMQAKQAVHSYLLAQKAYMKKCVINAKTHNALVHEMKTVAREFNQLLAEFDEYQMQRFGAL